MNEYIELKRFPFREIIEQIAEILEEHNIEYRIDDTTPGFDTTYGYAALVEYILKVKESDFEKANGLLNEAEIDSSQEEN